MNLSEKDLERNRAVFQAVTVGARIGTVILCAVCLCIAVSSFIMAGNIAKNNERLALRTAPKLPVSIGAPPSTRLTDKTGAIGLQSTVSIIESLDTLSEQYHIQLAVYTSEEAARNLYDDYFSDEKGLLLYLEDTLDQASLAFYPGDDIAYLFSPDNVDILNSCQDDLASFSSDHVKNMILDFRNGLEKVLYQPGDNQISYKKDTVIFTAAAGIFWLIIGTLTWFCFPSLLCRMFGLPRYRKDREHLKKMLNPENEDPH